MIASLFVWDEYPSLQEFLELRRSIFEANSYQVKEGVIFRRVFEMAAHLTVREDAEMILMLEIDSSTQAHDFISILPCNEMIAEPLPDEKRYEFLNGIYRIQYAKEKVLTSGMLYFRNNARQEELPDTDAIRDVAHEWMEWGIRLPEPEFKTVTYRRRVGYPRYRQFFNPLFHSMLCAWRKSTRAAAQTR